MNFNERNDNRIFFVCVKFKTNYAMKFYCEKFDFNFSSIFPSIDDKLKSIVFKVTTLGSTM